MENQGDRPKHSVGALVLLVINLLLAVCICLQLAFVVPAVGEMFRDFGARLPMPTQIVLNISGVIMAFYGLGFSILICFMVGTIIWTYVTLHRRGDRRTLFASLWTILLALIVLMGIMTITMFAPIFRMGTIVSGLS
jgi:hypothetical protein